jgi:hypothetical protein
MTFNRVLVCSQPDRGHLRRLNMGVIVKGAVISSQPVCRGRWSDPVVRAEPALARERDRVLFFVQDASFRSRELPNVLLVVGSGAPLDVQRLHHGRRIAGLSDAASLGTHYRQATAPGA